MIERVGSVQNWLNLPIPEPDELSWRRIEARLQKHVEAIEENDLKLARTRLSTVDIIRGRRWFTAGIAAVIVVALFVVFSTQESYRKATLTNSFRPTFDDQAAIVHSGAAPMSIEVGGYRVEMTSGTELVVPSPGHEPLIVELDHGRIDVWGPPEVDGPVPLIIRTPVQTFWASSRDFSIIYRAGHREIVEVRSGHVDTQPSGQRISAGQLHEFHSQHRVEAAEPRLHSITQLRTAGHQHALSQSDEPLKAKKGSTRSAQGGSHKLTAGAGELTTERFARKPMPQSLRQQSIKTPVEPRSESVQDDVTIGTSQPPAEVTALDPVRSPLEQHWADMQRAWYSERDANQTLAFGYKILELDPRPVMSASVLGLICDAQVSLRAGHAAARDCRKLLDYIKDSVRRRRIHFTLATIYRNQLSDCKTAITHYGRAVLLGGRGRFNETVRLGRAECALELGDIAQASTDLAVLGNSTADAERVRRVRRWLEELKRKARDATQDVE